jgi:hypothetical protein
MPDYVHGMLTPAMTMDGLMDEFAIYGGLVAVALLAIALLRPRPKRIGEFPYERKQGLFTPAERAFLGVLDQAAGQEYRVFGKVRVADILHVQGTPDRSAHGSAFNRISAKHFDFVLCRADDLCVAAVIELDDRSHAAKSRRQRDDFLKGACRAASLPLLRIPARKAYSVAELRSQITTLLDEGPADEKPRGARIEPTLGLDDEDVDATGGSTANQLGAGPKTLSETPICPKCAAPMVHRTLQKGTMAGEPFWGCSAFPRCRGVRRIEESSTANPEIAG